MRYHGIAHKCFNNSCVRFCVLGIITLFLLVDTHSLLGLGKGHGKGHAPFLSSDSSDFVEFSNHDIKVIIHKKYGNFTIQRVSDGKWLLFPSPTTSYLSVNIDSGHIYTNANFIPKDSEDFLETIQPVTKVDDETYSIVFKTPQNVEITETFKLSGLALLTKITAKNKDQNLTHTVGIRYLLDTQLDQNDGAPLYAPGLRDPINGSPIITHELKITNIPFTRWGARDNYTGTPTFTATGTLVQKPVKIIFGGWVNAEDFSWDYKADPQRSFQNDSCVLLYFADTKLPGATTDPPVDSDVASIYYGIGLPT